MCDSWKRAYTCVNMTHGAGAPPTIRLFYVLMNKSVTHAYVRIHVYVWRPYMNPWLMSHRFVKKSQICIWKCEWVTDLYMRIHVRIHVLRMTPLHEFVTHESRICVWKCMRHTFLYEYAWVADVCMSMHESQMYTNICMSPRSVTHESQSSLKKRDSMCGVSIHIRTTNDEDKENLYKNMQIYKNIWCCMSHILIQTYAWVTDLWLMSHRFVYKYAWVMDLCIHESRETQTCVCMSHRFM